MEQLKTYFNGLPSDEREAFAERCSTTARHIKNVMYGVRPCAPGLAVLIEKHSGGAVPRPTLRKDWQEIWPELVKPSRKRTPSPKEGVTSTQPAQAQE